MNDVILGVGDLNGRGVYAARNFKKGDVVIAYRLKKLTEDEYLALPESEKDFVHAHRGVKCLYSEPERFVNHSDHPNTYQDLKNGRDVALQDIAKGEMITTDASKDDQ